MQLFNEKEMGQLVDFCCRLIQTPSIHGEEEDAVRLLLRELQGLGYQASVDTWGNVLGHIQSLQPEHAPLLLDFHLDTVGVGDADRWRHPPFAGVLEGDAIYGRGASDMKGSLAAAVYGLKSVSPGDLKRDVYLSGSISEEIQEGAALRKVLEKVSPGLVIIGEPSNLNLVIGQRGRAEMHLFTEGISAHSSTPKRGVNAIRKMIKVMEALEGLVLPESPVLSPAILEVTDIHSTPYPGMSVLPNLCQVTYDRRLLVGEDQEAVLGEIRACLAALMREDPKLQAEVELGVADFFTWTGERLVAPKFAPAWYFSPEEGFVQQALNGLQQVGLHAQLTTYDFCTNGSLSAGELNIPTLGFGPGEEGRAHARDEYITVSELAHAARGFQGLVKALAFSSPQ